MVLFLAISANRFLSLWNLVCVSVWVPWVRKFVCTYKISNPIRTFYVCVCLCVLCNMYCTLKCDCNCHESIGLFQKWWRFLARWKESHIDYTMIPVWFFCCCSGAKNRTWFPGMHQEKIFFVRVCVRESSACHICVQVANLKMHWASNQNRYESMRMWCANAMHVLFLFNLVSSRSPYFSSLRRFWSSIDLRHYFCVVNSPTFLHVHRNDMIGQPAGKNTNSTKRK